MTQTRQQKIKTAIDDYKAAFVALNPGRDIELIYEKGWIRFVVSTENDPLRFTSDDRIRLKDLEARTQHLKTRLHAQNKAAQIRQRFGMGQKTRLVRLSNRTVAGLLFRFTGIGPLDTVLHDSAMEWEDIQNTLFWLDSAEVNMLYKTFSGYSPDLAVTELCRKEEIQLLALLLYEQPAFGNHRLTVDVNELDGTEEVVRISGVTLEGRQQWTICLMPLEKSLPA